MAKMCTDKNFFSISLKLGVSIFFIIGAFYFFPNLLSPAEAAIINPNDVQITPKFVTFSENEIIGNEVFYTLVSGRVTWTKSSPLLAILASMTKEARGTLSVEAQNKITGDWVTLNSAYSVYIKKPFPKKAWEYYQAEEKIPLQFSETAESGDYNLVMKFLKADVKFHFFSWIDIKNYLPQIVSLGSVKYIK